ncbi:cytochrome ubiquinol oxidase subunit II [Brevirhabdus sp.]|uniref:cytochrome ubiquinol oxidase subunit II n=1 Tax=Brevirhabdus sp. TaxID=2004514 RepID=UPI0040583577
MSVTDPEAIPATPSRRPIAERGRHAGRGRESRTGLRRALALVAAVGVLAVSGCTQDHITFLDPQGPVAAQQRAHFGFILAVMLLVIVPIFVLTPLILWRYRYRGRAAYRPKWDFSWLMEFLVWGGPVVLVAVLAVALWRNTIALDPWRPLPAAATQTSGAGAAALAPMRVQVVGLDWKWLFIYPDLGIATVNDLAFPVDRQIALEMTSATVLQSLFIPSLGSQVYAMGGMVSRLHLAASAPGRFRGMNAQYNGKGFHKQSFSATAMTPEAFRTWVEATRNAPVALDAQSYAIVAQRGSAGEAATLLEELAAVGGAAAPGQASPDPAPALTPDAPAPIPGQPQPQPVADPGIIHFSTVPDGFFATVVKGGPEAPNPSAAEGLE